MKEAAGATRADVVEAVCSIVAAVLETPTRVNADAELEAGLGMDSMALIETCVGIEERFEIAMPDLDELGPRRIKTVGDLADIALEQLSAVPR